MARTPYPSDLTDAQLSWVAKRIPPAHPGGQGPTPAEPNHPNPPATYKRPLNPVGHQGLFASRLNGNATTSPLEAYARTVYHNVNRTYDPVNARFLGQDDNSTGAPNLSTTAYHGEAITISIDGFEGQSLYGDGMSLYGYVQSNPINSVDPLGLEAWWDEDIDDVIADRTGHAMYTIGTLNEGARWASIGLNTAVSIAGGFLPGSGLLDAFNSVNVIASGGGGFWDAMNIAMVALPGIAAARAAARERRRSNGRTGQVTTAVGTIELARASSGMCSGLQVHEATLLDVLRRRGHAGQSNFRVRGRLPIPAVRRAVALQIPGRSG